MQRTRSPGKDDPGALRLKALGPSCPIRKKVKTAAMEALAHPGKQGRKQQVIPVEQYQKVSKELDNTKDALAAVGHELSLLKKKTS